MHMKYLHLNLTDPTNDNIHVYEYKCVCRGVMMMSSLPSVGLLEQMYSCICFNNQDIMLICSISLIYVCHSVSKLAHMCSLFVIERLKLPAAVSLFWYKQQMVRFGNKLQLISTAKGNMNHFGSRGQRERERERLDHPPFTDLNWSHPEWAGDRRRCGTAADVSQCPSVWRRPGQWTGSGPLGGPNKAAAGTWRTHGDTLCEPEPLFTTAWRLKSLSFEVLFSFSHTNAAMIQTVLTSLNI